MVKKQNGNDTMAIVRALFEESGLSLVELGRRMGYPESTARQSTWQFMRSNDPRMSVLQRFADAMSIPLDDLVPKRRGKRKMSRKLEDELSEFGCEVDAGEFRELLVERKGQTSPSWTVDELVCHPDQAKDFCEVIRAAADCERLPDDLILRTLMNIRRSP